MFVNFFDICGKIFYYDEKTTHTNIQKSARIIYRRVGDNMFESLLSTFFRKGHRKMIIDKIALVISIIGALNWGSIGLFRFDLVAWLFGGQGSLLSRIVYTLVGLSGVWLISLLFRTRENVVPIGE